jgi:hypothetical protein
MLLIATALLLGIAHAFGSDHLAAMSTFVSHRRGRGAALGVSFRWGIAHMMGVLVPGVLIALVAAPAPEWLTSCAEFGVGVVLIFVGVGSLRRTVLARKIHYHRHSHGALTHMHLHSHERGEEHYENHAVSLTGLVHGLAGAIPALALVPLMAMGSPLQTGLFLFVFGAGVILAMAAYCLLLSGLFRRLSETQLLRWAQPALACGSCSLGLFWMFHTGVRF